MAGSRDKPRVGVFSFVLSVLGLAAIPAAFWLYVTFIKAPSRVEVTGTVATGPSNTPVGGAQVLVTRRVPGQALLYADANSVFTDATGVFFAETGAVNSGAYQINVRSPGYKTYLTVLPIGAAKSAASYVLQQMTLDIEEPKSGPPDIPRAFRSPPSAGGLGADFSENRYCSPAQTDLPKGYAVKGFSFQLEGDRRCGSWATCQVDEVTQTQVCWKFRLQGHNECTGVLGHCDPRGTSFGLLSVTYGYVEPKHPTPTRAVYVQLGDQKLAEGTCPRVIEAGYFCPEPLVISFSGRSRIVYFVQAGATAAQELASHFGHIETEYRALPKGTAAVADFELWLR